MDNQIEWLKQMDKVHKGIKVICPNCGSFNVECSFFRFQDNMGYGSMKCKDCGDLGRISRMSFPTYSQIPIIDISNTDNK